MHFFKQLSISNGKYYVILLITGCLAYWPLTFHIFSLKNDAITYFLPWRFQISEAIQNGFFPYWSPYLYTGLPLHSDIQSGVWNPVVFMISSLSRYNMSLLEWETLFYILVAGIGFFKLCRFFLFDKNVCLVLSVSYMCCGFIIDSGSFIPWIASAAYLPFVFLFFLKTIRSPVLTNALKLAVSSSLLFLAGYPSFFIFSCYILLVVSAIYLVICIKSKDSNYALRLVKQLTFAVCCGLVICSPALISYIEFFPDYARGHGMELKAAQVNPFAISNVVSYIFPQASYKLHTINDISSRNAYIGLLPFIFLVYSVKNRYNIYQRTTLAITLACFLFSLGGATPVHGLLYHILPLTSGFRHPSTIRVFTSMGLLLLGGFGLNDHFTNNATRPPKKLLLSIVVLILSFILYAIIIGDVFHKLAPTFNSFGFDRLHIKQFLDSSSFSDWILISGIVQFFFILIILFTKKKQPVFIAGIVNVIVMAFLFDALYADFAAQYPGSELISKCISPKFPFEFSLAKRRI